MALYADNMATTNRLVYSGLSQATCEKRVHQHKKGMFLAAALTTRRSNLLDMMKVSMFQRMVRAQDPAVDFKRDEICDAEPEFTVEEPRAFKNRM
ncbi:hypothetical protein [Pyruvatibacter sp.]|uniref:hypothetical protein n=1 Tax=Pyruvatibacter sp. TaxID=1981328 RepID=UPI0032EF1E22